MPTPWSTLGSKAFGDHADRGLIVAYESHQDALRFLAAALSQANGIALLQGPTGSGKTTVVNEQRSWSSRGAPVALVDGAHLAPGPLLHAVLTQFGVGSIPHEVDELVQAVDSFLSQRAGQLDAPVLIVDNADQARASTLSLINWLAALEVHGRYALRIVMTGREHMAALARDPTSKNLARRHPAMYSLNPLTEQEAMIYLRTRLIAAGGERAEKVFPVDVCDWVYERSRGWPGRLNKYAQKVLDRMTELQSARQYPRMILTRGGETLGEFELSKDQHVVGRSEMADIHVEDSYVSKLHALLQVYSNAIVLIDLNSTNGTIVNSVDTPKTILKNNDIIKLGKHRLKLVNAPAIPDEVSAQIRAADTLTLQRLDDLRRSRAKRTIAVLKHR